MKYIEVLENPKVINELRNRAPKSHFSGNALEVVSGLDDQTKPESKRLSYVNCMDSDWWVGQQDGVYTRQIRQPITADEIEEAAIAAGLERDAVVMAMLDYRAEVSLATKQTSEYLATLDLAAEEQRLAKVAAYEQAAPDEKRDMLYRHFVEAGRLFGRRAKNRKRTLRAQIERETPPATFHF